VTVRTGADSSPQPKATTVEGLRVARGRGWAVERTIAAAQRRDAPGGGGEDQTLESVSRLAGVCQIQVRDGLAIRWQGTPTVKWWS
jgi:hypothetical protein